MDCTNLKKITIPKSVSYISIFAFNGCESLTDINVNDLSTWCNMSYGDYFFRNIFNNWSLYLNGQLVSELSIPSNVTKISRGIFADCKSLRKVTIPQNVRTIDDNAFYKCDNITNVTISNGVEEIGEFAFNGCNNLTDITIPPSITSIKKDAFIGCKGTLTIYSNIPHDAFTNTYFSKVIIENGVTEIGGNAFNNCTELRNVTLSNSVTYIGHNAFAYCEGLSNITIPNSVTYIAHEAFLGCTGLSSITIPKNVEIIEQGIFYDCDNLTCIYCKPTTPPTCYGRIFSEKNIDNLKIYVPESAVQAYKIASGWGHYADKIYAAPN